MKAPYQNVIKLYGSKRDVDPFSSTVAEGINFLGELYDERIG